MRGLHLRPVEPIGRLVDECLARHESSQRLSLLPFSGKAAPGPHVKAGMARRKLEGISWTGAMHTSSATVAARTPHAQCLWLHGMPACYLARVRIRLPDRAARKGLAPVPPNSTV